MKFLLVVVSIFVYALCQYAKDAAAEDTPKTYENLIPPDVTRDFSGMCSPSKRCTIADIGKSWNLAPYCGISMCVLSEDKPPRVMELVKDCGPLPLDNPKCKFDEKKTNKKAPFPDCCPIFKCEDGTQMKYPEIDTTVPPIEETVAPCSEAGKIQRTIYVYL